MFLFIPFFPIIIIASVIAILIYVIVKRVEDKNKENFEKRDN